MPVKKYSKKVEIVDALEYAGDNHEEIIDFCPEAVWDGAKGTLFVAAIPVIEGQWIARDEGGHFSVKSDFLTYYRPGGGP